MGVVVPQRAKYLKNVAYQEISGGNNHILCLSSFQTCGRVHDPVCISCPAQLLSLNLISKKLYRLNFIVALIPIALFS